MFSFPVSPVTIENNPLASFVSLSHFLHSKTLNKAQIFFIFVQSSSYFKTRESAIGIIFCLSSSRYRILRFAIRVFIFLLLFASHVSTKRNLVSFSSALLRCKNKQKTLHSFNTAPRLRFQLIPNRFLQFPLTAKVIYCKLL